MNEFRDIAVLIKDYGEHRAKINLKELYKILKDRGFKEENIVLALNLLGALQDGNNILVLYVPFIAGCITGDFSCKPTDTVAKILSNLPDTEDAKMALKGILASADYLTAYINNNKERLKNFENLPQNEETVYGLAYTGLRPFYKQICEKGDEE